MCQLQIVQRHPPSQKKILKISVFSSFRKDKFSLNIKTIENKTPIVTAIYQGIVYPYLEYYMQLCSSFFKKISYNWEKCRRRQAELSESLKT